MSKYEAILFVALVVRVAMWLVCVSRLSRQLRERHPDKFLEMELAAIWPTSARGWMEGFDNSAAVKALLAFLWRREYADLHDPRIHELGVFMRRLFAVYVAVFGLLVFSILRDIREPRATEAHGAAGRDAAFALHNANKFPQAIAAYDALVAASPDDAR